MFSADLYVTALRFAAAKHRDQRVPGPRMEVPGFTPGAGPRMEAPGFTPGAGIELPYVVHVVSVAAEVIAALPGASLGAPDLAVQCALLHDTVEDTGTAIEELDAVFGAEVAAGVLALTKDARVAKPERMADSLRRIRDQPREVWMVKLADRITNLAPPPSGWTREKCAAYRIEAIAIADALGAANDQLDRRLRARIEAYRAHT